MTDAAEKISGEAGAATAEAGAATAEAGDVNAEAGATADAGGNAGKRAVLGRVALVTALFSGLLAVGLLVVWWSAEAYPLEDWPEMQALQSQRLAAPADTALVEEIRQLDAAYRTRYLRRQYILDSGAFLLAAGLLATVGLLRWRASLAGQPRFVPEGGPEYMDRAVASHRQAAGGVLAIGGLMLVGLLVAGLAWPEIRHLRPVEGEAEEAEVPPNWPLFRGPTGDGRVPAGQWPVWWDGPSGAGIKWKQELPSEGKSSPVVWGDRVFVTSGDKQGNWLTCLSAEDGQLLWSQQVKSPPARTSQPGDDPDQLTGYAAPSPATDGQFVYVTYANADIACFDFDGNQRWERNYGPAQSSWGLSSSLALYRNLVIFQMDQGRYPEDGLSRLVALDKRSGREVWRVEPRESAGSWASPLVVQGADADGGEDLLIVAGHPHLMAYNPATGDELWRAGNLGKDLAPSPVVAGGLTFAAGENGHAVAVRLGGSGDVNQTHVVWESEEALPATVSPLAHFAKADDDEAEAAGYYLQITDNGALTCLSATDGQLLWQEELGRQAQPSPCIVDDVVYLLMADGVMLRFRLGPEFQLLSMAGLGEKTAATPAFSGGLIFIRGEKHLYCIEGATPPADGGIPSADEGQGDGPDPGIEVFTPPSDDIFGD